MYFKSGSTITLTCLISESPEPPSYVFWYHESRMINFDTSRGGITVVTKTHQTTESTLVITNAQQSDSGNYTCAPTNAEPTSVTVHVLNGRYEVPCHFLSLSLPLPSPDLDVITPPPSSSSPAFPQQLCLCGEKHSADDGSCCADPNIQSATACLRVQLDQSGLPGSDVGFRTTYFDPSGCRPSLSWTGRSG